MVEIIANSELQHKITHRNKANKKFKYITYSPTARTVLNLHSTHNVSTSQTQKNELFTSYLFNNELTLGII